jgi:hypothetical protein
VSAHQADLALDVATVASAVLSVATVFLLLIATYATRIWW